MGFIYFWLFIFMFKGKYVGILIFFLNKDMLRISPFLDNNFVLFIINICLLCYIGFSNFQ